MQAGSYVRTFWQLCCGGILGLALAGCQQPQRTTSPLTAGKEPTPRLRSTQVADVQVAMGKSLEMSGTLEQAQAVYEEAAQKDPQRADALDRLAVLAAKQGQLAKAEDYHRKALKLEAGNADLHCNYGYTLYLQHRWAEGEAAFRKALELKPNHARAQNNLALTLARSGRCDEALVAFQKTGCPKADAHANVAFALTLDGSMAEARQHYEIALKESPDCAAARKGLQTLQALQTRMAGSQSASSQSATSPEAALARSEQTPTAAATEPATPGEARE